MRIFLDPGHGGDKPGAMYGGLSEKDINLKFCLKLYEKLEDSGHIVVMSRHDDYFVKNIDRTIDSNDVKSDVFISIHCNAAKNRNAKGLEILYHKNSLKGFNLATDLINYIQFYTNERTRGTKADIRGLTVLNRTRATAVLIELGFMSNAEDLKKLQDDEYLEKIMNAICLAFVK